MLPSIYADVRYIDDGNTFLRSRWPGCNLCCHIGHDVSGRELAITINTLCASGGFGGTSLYIYILPLEV